MDNMRVYGKSISIREDRIKDFYNRQAVVSGDAGAVLLGNQDLKALEGKNAYTRDYVLPMLHINSRTRVLDIGCGIGRMAEWILPDCGLYWGVDFSEEMIKLAEQTCQRLGGEHRLSRMSALEAVSRPQSFYGGKFEVIIISGVLMYINDQDTEQIFRFMPNLLEEHCMIYLAEPVGLQQRLTLRDFPSHELQSAYSAIYRTPEEYVKLCKPLLDSGCSIVKQEFRPKFGENYSDTARYHFILQR